MRKIYCDRCGKEFDAWNQEKIKYDVYILPEEGWKESTDICDDCRVRLNKLLDDFFNNDKKYIRFDRFLSDEEIEAERRKLKDEKEVEE